MKNFNINEIIQEAIRNKESSVTVRIPDGDVKKVVKDISSKLLVRGLRTNNEEFLVIYL